jgi:3-oxoacyl-[acyl-carrier protein] reductase
VLDVDRQGVMRTARASLRNMGAGGSVTAVPSISGGISGWSDHAHYTTAKAEVIGLVRSLAVEYAPRGIRANAVIPGLIRTPQSCDSVNSLGPRWTGPGGWIHPDATSESAIETVVSRIVAEDGGLDVLVCAHGILTQSATADMSAATWRETIDVDLTAVFLLNRATLRPMLAQRHGRIINIASQLAIKGGVSLAHYAAAKAGVIVMTKSISLETAGRGVLVNAIAPGPIDTPMVAGIDDQWKRNKLTELPLGRFGTPEEVAPTAVLLASDPGDNLYVGQVLGPNSGDVMP